LLTIEAGMLPWEHSRASTHQEASHGMGHAGTPQD
jgi:hypothetical protein